MQFFRWIVLVIPGILLGYENSMPSLAVPTGLDDRTMEFSITHRAYTPISDLGDAVFGETPHGGVNAGLGLRLHFAHGFELKTRYSFNEPSKGIELGGSAAMSVPRIPVRLQWEVFYFNYRLSPDTREGSMFVNLALQSRPILQRIQPVLNIAYNHYNESVGLGTGLFIRVSRKVVLTGEYYPASDPWDQDLDDSAVFGIRVETYGHHFVFVATNNYENGVRRLMRGTSNSSWLWGFNIERYLQF